MHVQLPVRKQIPYLMRGVHGQCRLAEARRPGHHDDAHHPGPTGHIMASQRIAQVGGLRLATGEVSSVGGKLRRARRRPHRSFRRQPTSGASLRAGQRRARNLAGLNSIRSLRHRRCIAGQDPLVDTSQFRAWLDAELIDERPPRLLIGVQCLSPSSGAGQREHELGVKPLLQGMLGCRVQQLGY